MSHKIITFFQNLPLAMLWGLYALFYLLLQPKLGLIVSALGLILVLLSGWRFGKRGGFIGGLFLLVINMALNIYSTGDWENLVSISEYLVSVVILLLGVGVGHLHDLQRELRQRNCEIQEQKQYLDLIYNAPNAIVIQALKDSEVKYRKLFEDSPVAIWEQDISAAILAIDELMASGTTDLRTYMQDNPQEVGRLLSLVKTIDINQAALDLVDAVSKEELLENIDKLSTDQTMEVWKEQIISIYEGEVNFQRESIQKTLQGRLKNTLLRQTIPPGSEDTWDRVLISISDITELKQIQAQLRVAKQEAEQAVQAKADFLANMSHEIRTPLNAVIGMSSLLMYTDLNNEQYDYVRTVRSSSEALLSIINDILDFSKIEAGKIEVEKHPTHLRDLVESTLDLVAPKMAEKKLELVYIIENDVPIMLIGDSTRIRQILANLLSNAAKFTEKGEVVVTISSKHLKGNQYEFHFQVRDTGIGIPPDRIDRLFKSFSQVEASTNRRFGGTGLGLVISKQLTELMGGEIWVQSEVGLGTTFHFTLPAQASFDAEQPDPVADQASLAGKRLLIVDDNETNRLIVKKYTEGWGMVTAEAKSGTDALALVEKGEKYDLAILDYHMPEMDGFTLATKLHVIPGAENMPLIMISSLGSFNEKREMMDKFLAFIHKPIKPSQLLDVVVTVMAKTPVHYQKKKVSTKFIFDPEMGKNKPLHMLLVEDNLVNRKVAIKLLSKFGYQVDIAGNGLEAIQALERQKYEVVFMDIQMSEMDGEEATKIIHAKWPVEDHPWIIAMTAHALDGDREHLLGIGMDDYIGKPLDVIDLYQVLERIPKNLSIEEKNFNDQSND